MGKFIDLTGQRFGRLVVIERAKSNDNKGGAKWNCQCDCGNIINIFGTSLTRKNRPALSCGCLREEFAHNTFSITSGKAAFNRLKRSYINNSKKRNISFELSEEEFLFLVQKNCFYCNRKPCQTKGYQNNGNFIYNGIDRIDSSKGYIINNCVPCCGRCNQAKSDVPQSDFLSWIDRVYAHQHQHESLVPTQTSSDFVI